LAPDWPAPAPRAPGAHRGAHHRRALGELQWDLFDLGPGPRSVGETSSRARTMKIHGIIPPVATPMQANEDLDLPRLKSFIDHLIHEGVHGIFVLGTNSEFYA